MVEDLEAKSSPTKKSQLTYYWVVRVGKTLEKLVGMFGIEF